MRTNNKIVCTGFLCTANIFDTDPCDITDRNQPCAVSIFDAGGVTTSVALRVKDIDGEMYYVLESSDEYHIYTDGIKNMTSNDLLYAMSTFAARFFRSK